MEVLTLKAHEKDDEVADEKQCELMVISDAKTGAAGIGAGSVGTGCIKSSGVVSASGISTSGLGSGDASVVSTGVQQHIGKSHSVCSQADPVSKDFSKSYHKGSQEDFLNQSGHSIGMPGDSNLKYDVRSPSSLLSDTNISLNDSKRIELLKVQKKVYRSEKKRALHELQSTLKDPSMVIIADWLKVRGSLKSWTKLWCVAKPGLLVLYKDSKQKSSTWVGTVLLNTCELIERPSKKDGFCFKLFHPLELSIWTTRGPNGETLGALVLPLPQSYLIFRIPSESDGKCWMDALEIAQRCSSLLSRTGPRDGKDCSIEGGVTSDSTLCHTAVVRRAMDESECEKHFNGCEDEDVKSEQEEREEDTGSETDEDIIQAVTANNIVNDDVLPVETPYVENINEELGQPGEATQVEEIGEENKSIIWPLVKQVRPGMDLSKVALPTFILEPRSFLDKISDYYYHADILSSTGLAEDPFTRMKYVVKWYLSGFYKKPKGLKKPYNATLGETFRCYWKHPETGSRTFYIAEQISHHPPVTAFYVTNRKDGFVISGSILAKSKFYGNSLSAIMDGVARLTFLRRGEDYMITMPYAHCKGILLGTLTMELGGKVTIECEKTGYHTELEFKLKPFLGGHASNRIVGKIKLGSEILATIDGHWDQEIHLIDRRSGQTEMFWNPTPEVKQRRLRRYTVALDAQSDRESERVWQLVSKAILSGDTNQATTEKMIIEEAQRNRNRERKACLQEWIPRWFERDPLTNDWIYKYADLRPWDPMNDIIQYEADFIVCTKTRHQMAMVRSTSLTNSEMQIVQSGRGSGLHSRQPSLTHHSMAAAARRASCAEISAALSNGRHLQAVYSGSSSCDERATTNSHYAVSVTSSTSPRNLRLLLKSLKKKQQEHTDKLVRMQDSLSVIQTQLQENFREKNDALYMVPNRSIPITTVIIFLCFHVFIVWFFK